MNIKIGVQITCKCKNKSVIYVKIKTIDNKCIVCKEKSSILTFDNLCNAICHHYCCTHCFKKDILENKNIPLQLFSSIETKFNIEGFYCK